MLIVPSWVWMFHDPACFFIMFFQMYTCEHWSHLKSDMHTATLIQLYIKEIKTYLI